MNKDILKINNIFLFATLIWFFYYPYGQIKTYFIGGLIAILVYLVQQPRIKIKRITLIFGLFLIFSIAGQIIRLNVAEDPARDFTESIRWLYIFSFSLYLGNNIEKKERIFTGMIATFVFINFFISLGQFLRIPGIESITAVYGKENHIESSLGISNRSLGISSGPGQNGATSIVFGIYAFVLYYFKYEKKFLSFFILLSSFISTLLSQSQTSFVALTGAMGFILLAGRFYFPKKNRISKRSLVIITASLGYLFYSLIDDLGYLDSLFAYGLERNSYIARELKWLELISEANETPWLYLIGHGKSYFGENSGAMDNEYLFVLLVYGALVFLTLYALIIWSLIISYRHIKRGDSEALAYASVTLCGLISAWPNTFFTDGRVAVVFLFALHTWSNSRWLGRAKKQITNDENIFTTSRRRPYATLDRQSRSI